MRAGPVADTPAAGPPQDEETVLPNASVGIDRLRALLRRSGSGPSKGAVRFHRRAIRAALTLRTRLVGRAPEPLPIVAVAHLAGSSGLDARIGVGDGPAAAAEGVHRPAEGVRLARAAQRGPFVDGRSGPLPRAGCPTGILAPEPSPPPHRRRTSLRFLAARTATPASSVAGARRFGRGVIRRALGHERAASVAVAAILVFASLASAVPAFGGPPTGAVEGAGATPRVVLGGGVLGPPQNDGIGDQIQGPEGFVEGVDPGVDPGGGAVGSAAQGPIDPPARFADPEASAGTETPAGPFLADGTLLKPVAVDTKVPDARDRLVLYRVQSGDTLTGIARRFGISMMTLWWANDLTSKDELHVGQVLKIPPVDGLIVTVKDGDTLDGIAEKTGVSKETIAAFNGLTDEGLVVGQTLIVPGARGAPIPTPKPTPRPVTRTTPGAVSGPSRYSGGAFAWPVAGGYISQYFRYGHPALDIAADYGTPIRAAAAGTVVFAGWKNNGGGYQVWIAHGSGLYTGYYHMSAISVGRGQRVGRGQTIGRIGTSGWATGPHVHFEVWIGYPWESGSSRVNPLRYL